MANKKAKRTCEQCIHEHACQAWNMGIIQNMDATNCKNYETVKDSNAYFLGARSAEDDAYSRGCLAGIELGHKEALCGITQNQRVPENEGYPFRVKASRTFEHRGDD